MSASLQNTGCPLCNAMGPVALSGNLERRYFRCAECDLVFVHPDDRPRRSDETARYREHRNSRDDAGYVRFLQRLADPLCVTVPVGSRGLDVGCGPVPVLAELLTESGRPTAYFDPLFHPGADVFREQYDFVTCTEVVEHAHDPAVLFTQLLGVLRPAGTLWVMTSLLDGSIDFPAWWYRRDVTHVCFFSAQTMAWVARRYDVRITFPSANVVTFAT